MLVQFSIENFLSFDEEQVFSMVATGGDQHPTHLVAGEDNKGGTLLRAAAIYGPNASGKSNFTEAIRFAQKTITEGTRSSQSLAVRPFKLDAKSAEKLTKFEFVIRTHDVLYNYGFRLDSKKIHEEWLFATIKKQEVPLFERTTTKSNDVKVEFGSELKGRTKQREQFLQFIAQGMQPNQLFLTEANERKVTKLQPLMQWFRQALVVITAEPPFGELRDTGAQE